MAASFGCSMKGLIETSEFRQAHCRALLGCLRETSRGEISDCICCPTGLQWTTMCFQHGGIRIHWCRCCTASHQQCSMQVFRAWSSSYLGHSEIHCGTFTIHRCLVKCVDERWVCSSFTEDCIHHSDPQKGIPGSTRPRKLQANFEPHLPLKAPWACRLWANRWVPGVSPFTPAAAISLPEASFHGDGDNQSDVWHLPSSWRRPCHAAQPSRSRRRFRYCRPHDPSGSTSTPLRHLGTLAQVDRVLPDRAFAILALLFWNWNLTYS